MSFTTTLTTAGRTAVIALQGVMDGTNDDDLREKVEKAATLDLTELVLDMSALEQLSAAGIRAVTYARQQMADGVVLVVASPTDQVRQTLRNAGLEDSVAIRD